VLEWLLLSLLPASLPNAVLAFGITGWILSLAGLLLYAFTHLRLPHRHVITS